MDISALELAGNVDYPISINNVITLVKEDKYAHTSAEVIIVRNLVHLAKIHVFVNVHTQNVRKNVEIFVYLVEKSVAMNVNIRDVLKNVMNYAISGHVTKDATNFIGNANIDALDYVAKYVLHA